MGLLVTNVLLVRRSPILVRTQTLRNCYAWNRWTKYKSSPWTVWPKPLLVPRWWMQLRWVDLYLIFLISLLAEEDMDITLDDLRPREPQPVSTTYICRLLNFRELASLICDVWDCTSSYLAQMARWNDLMQEYYVVIDCNYHSVTFSLFRAGHQSSVSDLPGRCSWSRTVWNCLWRWVYQPAWLRRWRSYASRALWNVGIGEGKGRGRFEEGLNVHKPKHIPYSNFPKCPCAVVLSPALILHHY